MRGILQLIVLTNCLFLYLETYAFRLDDQCPFECQCDQGTAICKGMRYTEFPTRFPANTETLEVSESNFEDIPQNVLSGFPSLKTLRIVTSSIKYIHTCAFSGISSMNSITFSNVNITEIVKNGFHNIKDIHQIVIQNSYIHEIASYAFNNIQNVTKFRLHNVSVNQLDHASINNIRNVSEFEIIENSFKSLEAQPVKKLKQIDTTNISQNTFHSVLCGIENMFGTGKFHFNENRLHCVCSMPFFTQTRGRPLLGALNNVTTFSNNSCAGPAVLAGTLVENIDHSSICSGSDESSGPKSICPPTTSMQEIHNCQAFGAPLIPVEEVEVPTTISTNGATILTFSKSLFVLMVVISVLL